jgi:hypothetical protein
MCFALEKVYCPKETFFEELCIEKEPTIHSKHFTVGIFAMCIAQMVFRTDTATQ